AYVTVDCPGPDEAYRAVAAVAGSALAPAAVGMDRAAHGAPMRVAVLLEGDPDGTAERAGLLCSLLGKGAAARPAAPAWWGWPAAGDAGSGGNAQPGAASAPGGTGDPGTGDPGTGDLGTGDPGGGGAPGGAGDPGTGNPGGGGAPGGAG